MRGLAIVEFTDSKVMRGRAVVIAQEPASLRLELHGPLGHTAWAMVSNGTAVSIYEDAKHTTYAPGDPALPYRFSSEELVPYLLGSTPARPTGYPETRKYRTVKDSNGLVTEATKYVGGAAVLKIKMDDYRTISGRTLPSLISITEIDGSTAIKRRSLTVRFTAIEVNPMISDALFNEIRE